MFKTNFPSPVFLSFAAGKRSVCLGRGQGRGGIFRPRMSGISAAHFGAHLRIAVCPEPGKISRDLQRTTGRGEQVQRQRTATVGKAGGGATAKALLEFDGYVGTAFRAVDYRMLAAGGRRPEGGQERIQTAGQRRRHKVTEGAGQFGRRKTAKIVVLFEAGRKPAFEIIKERRIRNIRPDVPVKLPGQQNPLLPLPECFRPGKQVKAATAEIVAEGKGGIRAVRSGQGRVLQQQGVQHAPPTGEELAFLGDMHLIFRTDMRGKKLFQRRAREGRGATDAGPAAGGAAAEIGNGQTGFARQGVIERQGGGLSAPQEVDGLLILFAGAQGDAIGPGRGQQPADGVLRRCFPRRVRGRAQARQPRRQSPDAGRGRALFQIQNAAKIALGSAPVFFQQRRQQTGRTVQSCGSREQHARRPGIQRQIGHTLPQRGQGVGAAGIVQCLQRDKMLTGRLQSGSRGVFSQ